MKCEFLSRAAAGQGPAFFTPAAPHAAPKSTGPAMSATMATMKRKPNSNYVVVKENGVFVARCPDLDVTSQGATEQEAISNLEEALALYFEDLPGPADG